MIELAHHSALVPLLALVISRAKVPDCFWIFACAFTISWFADSAAWFFDGSWTPLRYAVVIQTALFALAFNKRVALGTAVALAPFAVFLPDSEIATFVIGSALVLIFARGPMTVSAILYCGLGSLFWIPMLTSVGTENFMFFWYAYQATRIAAYIEFLRQVRTHASA